MNTATRTAILWVCCALLVAPSAGGAGYLLAQYWRETNRFKPADALILESGVHDGPGRGANYVPDIRYRYVVAGVVHVSSNYSNAMFARDSDAVPREIVARYPPGRAVTAWYDPERPDRAVLVREMNWILLTVALVGCLIPVSLLYAYYRWLRPGGR